METLLALSCVVLGFVFLIFGADALIHGAGTMARRFGVSEFFIGLTVVAFGTSAPELFINIFAALAGNGELVVSNVLGSGSVNIALGLGLAAFITPFVVPRSALRFDIPIGFGALCVFVLLSGAFWREPLSFSWPGGLLLLFLFAVFLWFSFTRGSAPTAKVHSAPFGKAFFLAVLGAVGLGAGGHMVVTGASTLAAVFGVSQSFIGITIVAAGGSLPEVITCVQAARKKSTALLVGNVAGSQIFNVLLVLGVSGLVATVAWPASLLVDAAFLLGLTLLLMLLGFLGSLHRLSAIALVGLYAAYMVAMVLRG